jgi:hypothetical protein
MFEKPRKGQVVRIKIEAVSLDSRSIAPSLDGQLLADSSGSPLSPNAVFGNARLFARTAAYGFRCELTLSANCGRTE